MLSSVRAEVLVCVGEVERKGDEEPRESASANNGCDCDCGSDFVGCRAGEAFALFGELGEAAADLTELVRERLRVGVGVGVIEREAGAERGR